MDDMRNDIAPDGRGLALTNLDALLALAACPACRHAPLLVAPAALHCAACERRFPVLDSIPWLFPEPAEVLADWRGRLHLLLEHLGREAALHRRGLAETGLHTLTRGRLEHMARACDLHADQLRALLAPLELAARQERYEVHLALGTPLPASQGLTSYYANIHRDWAWGGEENAASLAAVQASLAAGGPPRRLLVLGAGAGRLAYDLHQSLAIDSTVALDFNPLLAAVGRRVSTGEALELHEFPIAPRTIADQAVLRRLAAPAQARPGLQFLLADARTAPFADGAFDAVLTPWFMDIVPDALPSMLRRVNRLLAPGGRWLFFGSLAWSDRPPSECYSLEEMLAILPAAGFSAGAPRETDLPYMRSPASRHARLETVIALAAVKAGEVEPPPPPARPDWLERTDLPVPALPAFREQSLSTRVYAFIMAMIDGRRSVRDMALLMEEQQLMPAADAETAIRGFLARMHADAERRANF